MVWIAGWYLLISLITFVVYGFDKHKARTEHWRIKERTLHLLELLGGWPGGFVAQKYFHHKSKKKKYQLVFWVISTIHIAIWAVVIYRRYQ